MWNIFDFRWNNNLLECDLLECVDNNFVNMVM